jgi:hypothetical protein
MSEPPEIGRRAFLGVPQESARGAVFGLKRRALLAPADLVYSKPAPRSEESIPVGNGRMGTLVWITPASLRMQIDRADVYVNDSSTNSFFERHNDYCGGCGFVDIVCAGAGAGPFPRLRLAAAPLDRR